MTGLLIKGMGALLLFGLSAGFSLAETAFMSLSRLQLARLTRARPGRLNFWQRDPERALAVLLLLNNVVNAGLAVLSVSMALDAAAVLHFPFRYGQVVFPVVGGALLILFCEVGPKVVARAYSEPLAVALAPDVCARRGRYYVDIACDDGLTRGMTIVDELHVTSTPPYRDPHWGPHHPNADVCREVNARRWKEVLYQTLR